MKLDASTIGAVRPRIPVDTQKVSSLVEAGQAIETVYGSRFRVVSKTACADGVSFLLRRPGTPRPLSVTAAQLASMEPLPQGIARLAHILRHIAYNRDFTQYINEAIKAHGLPTDPKMDWSKWLYHTFSTTNTGARNEESLDEALHEYIISLIYEKDILSAFDPKKLKKNKNEPKHRLVTLYLIQNFITYRSMIQRGVNRLQTIVPGKKAPSGLRETLDTPVMESAPSGEEDFNILDTPENAVEPVQEELDSWEDISRFRGDYGKWLVKTQHEKTADGILKLFDLIVNAEQQTGDNVTHASDYTADWMAATGKSLSYFNLIATKMSETLAEFVEDHPELAETSLIARLIGDIKKKTTIKNDIESPKSKARAASLNLVAAAPNGLNGLESDTGKMPHDGVGNTSDAVIIIEGQPPQQQPRTVAPEVSAVTHGF